jgi:hypothetical protein
MTQAYPLAWPNGCQGPHPEAALAMAVSMVVVSPWVAPAIS